MAHVGRDFWKKAPEARDTVTSIWTSLEHGVTYPGHRQDIAMVCYSHLIPGVEMMGQNKYLDYLLKNEDGTPNLM